MAAAKSGFARHVCLAEEGLRPDGVVDDGQLALQVVGFLQLQLLGEGGQHLLCCAFGLGKDLLHGCVFHDLSWDAVDGASHDGVEKLAGVLSGLEKVRRRLR